MSKITKNKSWLITRAKKMEERGIEPPALRNSIVASAKKTNFVLSARSADELHSHLYSIAIIKGIYSDVVELILHWPEEVFRKEDLIDSSELGTCLLVCSYEEEHLMCTELCLQQ
jgi:hypothetical protein